MYFYHGVNDQDREVCHQVLLDRNKKQQLLEEVKQSSSMDVAKYGIILERVWGLEIPQSFVTRYKQFRKDLIIDKLVCCKMQKEECEQIYYILPELARENDFIIAHSEEEIRRIGRILYSTRDEDPAESFCDTILKVYFGLAEHNSTSYNELFDSVHKGELQRVTTYLEEGGDVNFADEYGQSLIHHAAHSGKMDLVRFLKAKGANIHKEDKLCGRKPIHIAAKEGHPSVISFFVDSGAGVNESDEINWTLLHYAVWRGDLETIRFLKRYDMDINAKDARVGKTPIHIAAEHGYIDVINYLIENGANVESYDERGRTPLYYSVMMDQYEAFKNLIDKGADINIKNNHFKTLLHVSGFNNNKEIIEYLVKAGLEINAKDENGWTPLHIAVYNHKLDIFQVLADLGADLFVVCNDGKSLLDISKEHADIVLHVVYRMCKKFQEEGKYSNALELCNENLEIIKTFRQDHPDYLEMENKLGIILYEMGKFDVAADILTHVLRNREISLGTNHFSTLSTKHRLASVYAVQWRHNEAMDLLKGVLEARKTVLGDDHDDTLNVSNDIGKLHIRNGEYDEALEMFKLIVEKRDKHFGSDHHKTLQARQDMAVIFANKGDFEKALFIFKDVLGKRAKLLGENHPDTVLTSYHVKLTSEKVQKNSPWQSCLIS
ncbi:hypothetical protein JTE90_007613 [Oedothorax gibbosus]|uniref:Uncharacterized protein n=1 Tax=Oedothorax gibbosus TaxID=931172 RepID=A0AAV6U4W9_9ARAC|nr:hypothetical protein JTE90_007613 [Oedothorax gibbosus]